jgi:mersacidin/lichenicidin family type 2 lantibiotic
MAAVAVGQVSWRLAGSPPDCVARQQRHDITLSRRLSRTQEDLMHDVATIRAWKDAAYRDTLGPEDAMSGRSPAGSIELEDGDLSDVAGGAPLTETSICGTTLGCVAVVTIAVSKNMSCGACDTTLWSGSCAVSSVGCCP